MRLDWIFMIVSPMVATLVSLIFGLGLVETTIMFFGAPAAYLVVRKPAILTKTLIFTGVVMVGIISLDHSIYLDQAWYVPNSILRLFKDTVTIEELIWAAVWIFFAIVMWEYFLDTQGNKTKLPKKFGWLMGLVTVIATGFAMLYLGNSSWLVQPYYYLKFGLVFVAVPIVIGMIKCPKLWKKVVIIGLYFFVVSWVHELVSLRLNHWYFPGANYIGTVLIEGKTVPSEEIIFWWILGVPALVYWYELFADDGK